MSNIPSIEDTELETLLKEILLKEWRDGGYHDIDRYIASVIPTILAWNAKKVEEAQRAAEQKGYKQGVSDALFRPEDHTPEEIAVRNRRLAALQDKKQLNQGRET